VEVGIAGPNVFRTKDITKTFVTKLLCYWFAKNLLGFRYFTLLLTYSLTYLLHGAESFLRS